MSKENALLNAKEEIIDESFDLDELEEKFQSQLEETFADLEFLKEEEEQIGNPDNLGEVIKNVVWEQFVNQIASKAGDDFIKENNGLHLDLRKEAHIQTTENFANGKIATHNTEIDYQKRYDDWQSNFVKDENGNIVTHKTRSGKTEATLVKGARKPFDEGRPSGSSEKHTDMDHTISAAEIIRDSAANAHMTKEEQIAFANSDANLNEMDSSLNRSKGDKSMSEWLDTPNSKGQKPNEIFDISDSDDAELRQKDAEAREEYEKLKKEAEQRSIEAGKKSRRDEAKRIGGKAVRAVVMQLLAELVKEIIAKLVKWFKLTGKKLQTLLSSLKEAIISFVGKLKTHLINAADSALTTIATAIFGPVINTIKKMWTLLKQGWKSLKEAIAYIKSPESKGKPIGLLILEIGKIVMAGLSAAGAIVLGEAIEKALIAIPGAGAFFAFEIPLIGSLANILGIFLGAVVAGIVGAIVINMIEKAIEKQKKNELLLAQIDKSNEILESQNQLIAVQEMQLEKQKIEVAESITQRHDEATAIIKSALGNIYSKNKKTAEDIKSDNEELFNKIEDSQKECDNMLDNINNLLDGLT